MKNMLLDAILLNMFFVMLTLLGVILSEKEGHWKEYFGSLLILYCFPGYLASYIIMYIYLTGFECLNWFGTLYIFCLVLTIMFYIGIVYKEEEQNGEER